MAALQIMAAGVLLGATLGESPLRQEVAVAHSLVTLGDLVDLSSVPASLRLRAARIEVARARAGASSRVTQTLLMRRIRAQQPALGNWAQTHVVRDYAVSYRPPAAMAQRRCLLALRDLSSGDVLRSADFAPADCAASQHPPAYRYAPAERTVRAREAIAKGALVLRFAGYAVTGAYPGDTMTLVAASGPVTVSRKVQALQAARGHERLLVRTTEGLVLSVAYAGVDR